MTAVTDGSPCTALALHPARIRIARQTCLKQVAMADLQTDCNGRCLIDAATEID